MKFSKVSLIVYCLHLYRIQTIKWFQKQNERIKHFLYLWNIRFTFTATEDVYELQIEFGVIVWNLANINNSNHVLTYCYVHSVERGQAVNARTQALCVHSCSFPLKVCWPQDVSQVTSYWRINNSCYFLDLKLDWLHVGNIVSCFDVMFLFYASCVVFSLVFKLAS